MFEVLVVLAISAAVLLVCDMVNVARNGWAYSAFSPPIFLHIELMGQVAKSLQDRAGQTSNDDQH